MAVVALIFATMTLLLVQVDAASSSKYRLPSHVKPLNYKLTLQPDLSTNTVHGRMLATVTVSQYIRWMQLNAKEVNILSAPSLSGRLAANVTYNEPDQTVNVTFKEVIPPGIWELGVAFKARINTALSGVFRVSAASNGSSSPPDTYVTSHFEPTDARKAFPCWDEPALKATYDLTLIVPTGQLALSNTPIVSRKPFKLSNGKFDKVRFARTPLMSTYLLAFVIGKFDRPLQTVDSNGVKISVYAPVGRRDEGALALSIANNTLPHYTKLFGTGYPLAKMDLVSLPDFPSIAMENWGLVLTHEPSLLASADTPTSQRTFITVTVMHELAHQWFGNLVTPVWWSDLWLNEGFATWLSYFAANDIVPGFSARDHFVRTEKLTSMRDDALEASHPIEAVVRRPADTAELFDSISYGKGAALLSMLHDWLGNERFFNGLRSYIQQHRYSNAKTEDLWRAMQAASEADPPVTVVMRDWTTRQGFPTINVAMESADPDDDLPAGCVLKLRQNRYQLPGADRTRNNWHWRIPVSVATKSGDVIRRVMTASSMTLHLPDCGWAMLNPNGAGYYRTAYTREMMQDLTLVAENGAISSAGRLTLIDDIFAMQAADIAWTQDPLKATDLMLHEGEPSLNVWTNALEHLYDLGGAVNPSESVTYKKWLKYLRNLCFNAMKGSSGEWRRLRASCLDYAGDKNIVDWAVRLFPRWVNGSRPKDVSPDEWSLVCQFAVGSGAGTQAEFNQLLASLNSTANVERRESILGCLGAFGSRSNNSDQLISMALGNQLRSSEVLRLVESLSPVIIWRLLTKHWKTVARRFEGPYMLKQMVSGLVFQSKSDAQQIQRFFHRHTALGIRDAVRKQVERIMLMAERAGKDMVEMRFLVNNVLGVLLNAPGA